MNIRTTKGNIEGGNDGYHILYITGFYDVFKRYNIPDYGGNPYPDAIILAFFNG